MVERRSRCCCDAWPRRGRRASNPPRRWQRVPGRYASESVIAPVKGSCRMHHAAAAARHRDASAKPTATFESSGGMGGIRTAVAMNRTVLGRGECRRSDTARVCSSSPALGIYRTPHRADRLNYRRLDRWSPQAACRPSRSWGLGSRSSAVSQSPDGMSPIQLGSALDQAGTGSSTRGY